MESVENDKKKQRKTLQHLHTNIPIVKGNIFYILHDNHNLLGTNIFAKIFFFKCMIENHESKIIVKFCLLNFLVFFLVFLNDL
jgi:hypothetical protein